jgi:hypothetical protein
MAEDIAPPNGPNADVLTTVASGDGRVPLANLDGQRSQKLGPKAELTKELEATLGLERLKTKSALKRLADLDDSSFVRTTSRCTEHCVCNWESPERPPQST